MSVQRDVSRAEAGIALAHGAACARERQRRGPGRPPASTSGAVATRRLILSQARRLFLQRGFASVSVGEVADAVGVTKPTLYYHFGDKEALYAAVLCDVMDEIGGCILRVTKAPLSVRERLYSLVYGYFLRADSAMEPLLRDTNELIGKDRAALVRTCYEHNFLEPMRGLMVEGVKTGALRQDDPDLLVRALMALLDGFIPPEGHTARSPREHQRMASIVVSFFMDGAASREVLSS